MRFPLALLPVLLFLAPAPADALSVRLRTGETLSGDVVATDGDGFRLKRWDNGGVIALTWELLAPEDARRVRKTLTLPEEGEREMIDLVRIQTKNGSFLEGKVLEETADKLTLKTREGTKHVPVSSILKRETVQVDALTLFTAKEIYDERLKGASETDPSAQFDLGSLCVRLALWPEAEQHFLKAAEIDPSMKDKVDQRMATVTRKKNEQEALALVKSVRDLLDDRKAKDARTALERLKTEFAALVAKEELDALEAEVAEAERGGTAGVAKGGNDDKMFKDFLALMAALLKKPAGDRQGTFEGAKEYMDRGLLAEIQRELGKRMKLKQEDLEERWKNRSVSQTRKASYGEGTWVLEGRKLKKSDGENLSYEDIQKAKKEDEAIQDLWQKDRRPFPQLQEDWWKAASAERRYAWLEAYAAEKLMKVEEILWVKCRTCGGKGLTGKDLCKTCNGVKNEKTIVFK